MVAVLFLPACSNDYDYKPPAGSRETAKFNALAKATMAAMIHLSC
jgi:hypothetical protein